ncbi:uncharacterized protein BXZ73DRAFT_46894 [Epithele typhae]|uniref:uncharacterized protein n=1 Tax=Epithele typhae TaxID=378194 RepID=UPI002007B7A4|nr:uncharacterized protein BXZ73DRAFT_46894 [Epithele typhae]KAH9932105.1 hypothetical protein BXZ73DRAFT_46894 [Epithele typhae]
MKSSRPILKCDPSPFRSPVLPFHSARITLVSPHVHFPPTPVIAATYPAYSPTTYDRQPIAVSPNVVQIPHRGARRLERHSPPASPSAHAFAAPAPDVERRGRTRSRSGSAHAYQPPAPIGSYFHPRAYEACVPEPPSSSASTSPAAAGPSSSTRSAPGAPVPPLATAPKRRPRARPELPPLPALVHRREDSPSDESDTVVTPPPRGEFDATAALSSSGPPIALQLPVPPGGGPARHRKPVVECASDLERIARGRRRRASSFSPDIASDEGCLGGF